VGWRAKVTGQRSLTQAAESVGVEMRCGLEDPSYVRKWNNKIRIIIVPTGTFSRIIIVPTGLSSIIFRHPYKDNFST
jgi:hypothetical protein